MQSITAISSILGPVDMLFDVVLNDLDPLNYNVFKHSLPLVQVELTSKRVHFVVLTSDCLSQSLVHNSSSESSSVVKVFDRGISEPRCRVVPQQRRLASQICKELLRWLRRVDIGGQTWRALVVVGDGVGTTGQMASGSSGRTLVLLVEVIECTNLMGLKSNHRRRDVVKVVELISA